MVTQPDMRIILSHHAKKRMNERNIKLKDVKDAIDFPDYTISKDNKKESYKRINAQILKIVYFQGDSYIKVITLMWK